MASKCEVRKNTQGSDNLEKFVEEPPQRHPIKSGESLNEAFMRKSARFNNLAEALKENGRKIEFTEDTKDSRAVWDELIRNKTEYDGWDDLCMAARAVSV